MTWLALVASGTSGQNYDAAVYTNAPFFILDGGPVPPGYGIRGVLSWLVYLPAALGTKVGMSMAAGVLVQNAALLAALGAFLLPAILAHASVGGRWRTIWCCAMVAIVLGRFAPLGLMDVWAFLPVLGAIILVARPSAVRIALAGALMGAAVNLRPAYLIVGLVLLLMWAVWIRRGWIWLALGSLSVVVSQAVSSLFRPGSFTGGGRA